MGVPAIPGTVSYQISRLAAQLMAKQRLPLQTLQAQRDALSQRASVLGTLKTKMLALHSALENLTRPGDLSPFSAKSAASSDPAVVVATVSMTAQSSTASVTVSHLAARATHVSNVYSDSATTVSNAGTGTFTFRITTAGNEHDVSVAVNAGDSDASVLENVAAAVNAATGTRVSAVRIHTATGQSRLSITSGDTGTAAKVAFTDTDGLLDRLGLSHGTPSAATNEAGGYIHEDLGNHELDASLVVNGVVLYRDSNSVTDAISGATLTLKATSPTAVTVKIQPDADQVLGGVKDFIAKYNEVVDYLNHNTALDPRAGIRGSVALDPVFASLAGQLRAKEATIVRSQSSGQANSLAALGIRAGADGKLALAHEATFRNAFRTDPSAVSGVFNGTGGVVNLLDRIVANYAGYSRQIALSQNQLSLRIASFDTQITRTNGLLASRQARLEDELARGQALLQKPNAQASQLSQITALLGQSFGAAQYNWR